MIDWVRLKRRLEAFLPEASRDHLYRVWGRIRGNAERRIAAHLSVPTMISIDAGACFGEFASILADASLRCEAFEANPDNCRILEEILFGKNVRIHRCALSDVDGQATLRIPLFDGIPNTGLSTVAPQNALDGAPVRTVTVPSCRLDSLDLPPVGFMKIDVEGHELAVLRGAWTLLERDMPNLFIEAEEQYRPGAVTDLVAELTDLGYIAYFLFARRLKPIVDFRPEIHQNPENIIATGVVPARFYANNFVFVTRPSAVEGLLGRAL